MTQYVGFSTINANKPQTTAASTGIDGGVGSILANITPGKKFRLTDEVLVLQDLVNAFNINRGEKVGQPAYGSAIWTYVFEQNDGATQTQLEAEVTRIVNSDPRLLLNSVKSYPQENGILIEVELAVQPFNNPQVINIMFDTLTSTAYQVPE